MERFGLQEAVEGGDSLRPWDFLRNGEQNHRAECVGVALRTIQHSDAPIPSASIFNIDPIGSHLRIMR